MQFFPVVHESYGRLGAAAEKLLQICADRIAASKRIPKASVLFYWRSRLSILLQKVLARASQERFLNINNRSEEHTSELQSLMRISYAVFCLKKKKQNKLN